MQRFTHDLVYDAPLAAVAAMLRDPGFREEVCRRQHVLSHAVEVTRTSAGAVVTVEQVQAAHGLPSFAQKFIGSEITIVQQETWTSLDQATVQVLIPGKPGEMAGSVRLTESAGRTTERVDLSVSVSLPLVGGKVEAIVCDLLGKALAVEAEVGRDYLSR